MAKLQFTDLPGSWKGNDYNSVSITSVSVGPGKPLAFIFMTHMNVDYDGAPNAYGPPEKTPLDSLENAGRFGGNGYYGLISVVPGGKEQKAFNLKVDNRFPDNRGRCPVIQQTGPYAGYFVSTTSKRAENGSASGYEQSHYIDSGSIAFSALSYGLESKGVQDKDLGIAIRLDKYQHATFTFMGGEGHGKGSAAAGAVGECSYRTFLDIGGSPKTAAQKYANNNFPTVFIVFPGSKAAQFALISQADCSEDFAGFLSIQAHVDAHSRGRSGVAAFAEYVAGGRKNKPPYYPRVVQSLAPWGYQPNSNGSGSPM
jgi:hypothetical protein